ncbi:iron ABC transporter substrate-binding protein [Saccharomonospora piscinae]|uniref:Iron ABC transporter substrate-binding protein n=1 Tax=Saccharomonospora piscinae TaxID=687388 RepID=A0A1V9A9N4_SACPI|nr:iron-siderophore ABC transporter substrate-binding protein [Saccharomonospora piscinae]OQO93839.1 iron ABC transporter substrate-binding protein [Saccharomonospora piscinae]
MSVLSRGRRVAPAVLAVTALLLAACSGGTEQAGQDGAGPVEAESGALPVTLDHRFGSTTVDEAPKRVVSVGYTDQDALLALGVTPVATTRWFSDYPGAIGPWARDALGGADDPVVLDDTNGIQFERIAELRPDLIVGLYSDLTREEYDTLSEIAPTVAPPPDLPDYGMPWRDLTTTIGRAVGKPDEARRVVAEVDDHLASIRAEHPEFEGATALIATLYEGYFLYGGNDPRSVLLTDLGLRLPDRLGELVGDQFGASVSRERADVLDTDVLLWLLDDDGEALRKDTLYSTLPVAKQKREVMIDNSSDFGTAFSQASVLSVPYIVDDLVPRLSAALDGDPATTG